MAKKPDVEPKEEESQKQKMLRVAFETAQATANFLRERQEDFLIRGYAGSL